MQFAILISVLVALVLGAFLMLTHVHSFFKIKTTETRRAFGTVYNALLSSMDQITITNDTLTTAIEGKNQKQCVGYYGAWIKHYVAINNHEQKIAKAALSGTKQDAKTPNLYLENNTSALVVVGDTRLEGNSYLPKQGVKAGNISGKYYQGNALYYGVARESERILPQLDKNWLNYINAMHQGVLIEESIPVQFEKDNKNSFNSRPNIIFSESPIVIEDQKIAGNFVIQSKSKIVVYSTAQLTDVILIAPEINIRNGVKGSFQAFATKKLQIGKQCQLFYPSSLVLLDQNREESSTNSRKNIIDFSIGSNTLVEGIVLYLKNEKVKKNRVKTHLEIQPNAEIIGEVYCEGNVDFQGTVWGSLYAKQFIAKQYGSVYLNHIYNGKVLKSPVEDYVGLPFQNTKHGVAKWLY